MDAFTALDPDTLDTIAWQEVPTAPSAPPAAPDAAERVRRAFDAGADLRLEPPPPEAQPGEAEGRTRRKRRATGGKQVGGEAMGAMAVAGFSILVTFVVGGWAAPTEEEANALAVPIGNILARRIDLAAKLGADADDTLLLMLALMSYGARVAPEAVNRSRDAWQRSRDAKPRVVPPRRADAPLRSDHTAGAGGVPDGQDDGAGAPFSATGSPIDVVTGLGERTRRGLGIDTPAHS